MTPKRKNAVRFNIPIVKSDVPYKGTDKPVLLVCLKVTQRSGGPLLALFIILKFIIFWSFSKTLGIRKTYEVIEVDLKCFGH